MALFSKDGVAASPENLDKLRETLETLANVLQDGLSDEAQAIASKILQDYPATLRDSCGASDIQIVSESEKAAVVYAMVRIASAMLRVRAKPDKDGRVLN